jgi:AraC family transcriptional activator of pobA
MSADGRQICFETPALLLVPTRCVHGFAWDPESVGRVLTLSEAYLGGLVAREPSLRALFELPDALAISVGSAEHRLLTETFSRLSKELSWAAPGYDAAIEACVMTLLVETMRLSKRKLGGAPPGPQGDIVARFRKAIEGNFHKNLKLSAYACILGLNVWQLRSACLKIARQPPLAMVQERKLLEAQRLLLYSNMIVSEVAYHLGFDDPAYFSRMFRRLAGESPRTFRMRHAAIRG